MSRPLRIQYPDAWYHLMNRGRRHEEIYIDKADYIAFIELLHEVSEVFNVCIAAYCLMPNHVHFVAIPENKNSLAKTFNACHMRYAHYFNKRNYLTGHLWQGRYYSCILDDKHLYATVRYIENNPVRAQLVKEACQWNWSSAKDHLKKGRSILSIADISDFMEIDNWQNYLSQKEDEKVINKIKANTLTGRPLGDNAFISKLEELFGRRLKALPHGRPRKE